MLLLLQRVWPPRAPLSKARPKMPVTMNVKGGSGSTTPRRSSTGGAPPTHADFIKLQAELLKLRIENEQLREENRHLREERTSTNRRHCGSGSGSSNGQLIVGNAKATGASDAIFFAGAPAAAAADKSSAQGEKRKSWMKKRRSSKAEAETAESVQGDDAVDEGGAEEEKHRRRRIQWTRVEMRIYAGQPGRDETVSCGSAIRSHKRPSLCVGRGPGGTKRAGLAGAPAASCVRWTGLANCMSW